MAIYVILGRWTSEGVQRIQEGPKRLDDARKLFKDRGAELREFYLLFGHYDFLAIVDAKDDAKLAGALLEVVGRGTSSTETFRAFDEDEYRKIVKGIG